MRLITINSNEMDKSIKTKEILIEKLKNKGFLVSETIKKNTELIISIGGDGSFLKTVKDFNFPNIPIVAINTGHLGFFAELDPDGIDEFLSIYENKEYFIQNITSLSTTIFTQKESVNISSVNEAVIRNIYSRTIHLSIKVNERKIQNFSGDGILISTPIGSTAYNYSAGGSIVDPALDVLQLTPLAPMNTTAYRSFTSSIVLPCDYEISLIPENNFENTILIVADGVEYKFDEIEYIKIKKSDEKILLLRKNNYEFWSRACEKFI